MNGLANNPLVAKAFRHLPLGRRGNPVFSLLLLSSAFAVLILAPICVGVCPCTMFTIGAAAMVLCATLGVGNAAFGALTSEREKKTLDSLRLTQLSPHEVLLGKLLPEMATLGMILVVTAPWVLIAGFMDSVGWSVALGTVLVATLGGVFSACMGIFFSSLFATTSQAVVAGWIAKAVWLVATPLLDTVASAVLVQNVAPPVFSQLNPLAALGVLLVPEAANGARVYLPVLFPLASIVASLLMWWFAAWRFSTGMASGAGMSDRQLHAVYKKGWGPAWLSRTFPMLRDNPAFLRELAAQVRSGAGRWPGYMVFLVLFLAPTFYARSWTLNELTWSRMEAQQQTNRVQVVGEDRTPDASYTSEMSHPTALPTPPKPYQMRSTGVRMRTAYGTEVVLTGHTTTACLRMALFQNWGVPLPKHELRFYRTPTYSYNHPGTNGMEPVATPDLATANAMNLNQNNSFHQQSLSDDSRSQVTLSSLHVGIAGAIALLLLYLGIRFSAFLATAVSGERSRRTWEDLALTGMGAREAMLGKVIGSIILPTMQMTVTFPALMLFVVSGNMGVLEVGALYVYALALSVTAAMLGLWASADASSSHDAHLRALVWVLMAFFALPLGVSVLYFPLIAIAVFGCFASFSRCQLLGGRQYQVSALAWFALAVVIAVAPQSLSPLTAAVSFMPSLTSSHSFLSMLGVAPADGLAACFNLLCGMVALTSVSALLWNSALSRLADPQQAEAIRAEGRLAQPAWAR